MYIRVRKYICFHIYIHVQTYIHEHVYEYINIHIHTHICEYTYGSKTLSQIDVVNSDGVSTIISKMKFKEHTTRAYTHTHTYKNTLSQRRTDA